MKKLSLDTGAKSESELLELKNLQENIKSEQNINTVTGTGDWLEFVWHYLDILD